MGKKLTVTALGGLCNRLRVLFSALTFHRETGIPVKLVWQADWQCKAKYSHLFKPIKEEGFKVVEGGFFDKVTNHRNLYTPALPRSFYYGKQFFNYHPNRNGNLIELFEKYNRIYLSTGYTLMPYTHEITTLLHPKTVLQDQVDFLCQRYTENTVGVHIRRTDNEKSIIVSTDDAFIEAMKQEEGAKFFIASDDEEVKWKMREIFKGRTITQETDARRDIVRSLQDAVVDLYCLTRTRKILGSYWSSFSDEAAEIGNIPMIPVGFTGIDPDDMEDEYDEDEDE